MIYLNGMPLNVTMFPDNTSQVWKLDESLLSSKETRPLLEVRWEFSHEGEFMHLAQLKALIDGYGKDARLTLKYLPYGRQDKDIDNSATFALTAFAYLLNTLDFYETIIVDPHSLVALKLIHRSRAVYPITQLIKTVLETGAEVLCYPDKGAVTKYTKIEEMPFVNFPYIYGEKVRDQLTGNILNYALKGDPSGKNILIMDDICDGGMTFKLLAKDLLAAGTTEVNLFVTHGIFSRGLRTLHESGIKRIFTQDGEASEVQNQITYRRL